MPLFMKVKSPRELLDEEKSMHFEADSANDPKVERACRCGNLLQPQTIDLPDPYGLGLSVFVWHCRNCGDISASYHWEGTDSAPSYPKAD